MKFLVFLLMMIFPAVAQGEAAVLAQGSGSFEMAGGKNHPEKKIQIYYYLPSRFNHQTKVIIVLPGAGRNGWSYRDSWIEASEKYNLLVLSPSYSEESYPRFWNYNLARMLSDVEINKAKTAISSYKVVDDSNEWIYSDFDRIFEHIVASLNLDAKYYDMFGHSAGGQILHRMALFSQNNKANKILAANSGWYTIPTFSEKFPYGLSHGVTLPKDFGSVFSTKLVLFLGELDDESETRGHLVRNPQLDKQGTHRLSRGKNFYQTALNFAQKLNVPFSWKIQIVHGVGHDYKKMSKAAAKYLYAHQAD
ncbi:hypothetical protein [Aliikangiella sp. IMCC44632]